MLMKQHRDEITRTPDRIQEIADELARSSLDTAKRMNLATDLRHEVRAARVILLASESA